ncbi:MAG: type II secretion system F family protein, partial [bacterium]
MPEENEKKGADETKQASSLREALLSKMKEKQQQLKEEEVKEESGLALDLPPSREEVEAEGKGEEGEARPHPRAALERLRQPITFFAPGLDDMAMFARQLATLLDVGIPLLRSLRLLSEHTQHPKLRGVVGQVAKRVEEGSTLSSALSEHPKIFSSLFVSVVRVGEVGGILESSLIRLADIMEKKLEIRKKVTSACLYPAVSMSVALGVVFLVMWKAVPRFVEIYKQLKADLPTATKQLIAVSNFVTAWPKVYVPVLILLIAGLILYKKTPTGRRLFDFVAMKSPILGTVNTKINVARVTRTLG